MARPSPDLGKNKVEEVLRVGPSEAGVRLDLFLKTRLPWRSREHLKERVRGGFVLVNGEPGRVTKPVRAGDEVRVTLERTGVSFDPSTIPLPVIYEDDVLLAIDKPAGFVVHPVGVHQMDTIINALHHRYRRPEDPDRDVIPKLAHRLDQYTSGVLLVAKRDDVRGELGRQFEEREVRKEYLAIVRGRPEPPAGAVEAPIGTSREPGRTMPMVVRDDGEPSLTLYEVERDLGPFSLVRCRPMSASA
ncbi:MAG: RluA family pseudouridine synthase, partial [Planctomycetes bacterium]|nr:RluA family pseudouridine synthase [Planctomycetota bacterium]